MDTLPLKKVWDEQDTSFYSADTQCFSASGYKAYWEAVNKTVRYFDSIVLKKREYQGKNPRKPRNSDDVKGPSSDRFRWQNAKLNRSFPVTYKKLKTPPAKCR